ncbi:hypothetical protein GCM10009840_30290 [Pseudolysinimonas kribbensis]|uniref:hypothetical protein n=1 Tax=Pseudolysinimonas kribbensis TaxID=433641 RepID=UPI0031D0ED46
MRAFVSLVIAVVLSVAGHLLVWGGGWTLHRLSAQLREQTADALLPSVVLGLGVLCLAGAMLTVAWSSVGVVIIGLVQTLTGLGIIILPAAIWAGTLISAERIYRPVGDGLFAWWASGLGLLVGLLFLVAGMATAARRPRSTAAGRVVTTVLSLVLGAGAVLLVALGGARLIQSIQQRSGGIELLGVLLVLAAAVLVVIVIAGVRFSSLGAIVLGVLLGALGGLLIWSPQLVLRPIASNRALTDGLRYAGDGGGYLVLGVLVLVAGIAGVVRARRRRAMEPVEDVDERIGYQPEDGVGSLFPFGAAGDDTPTGPIRTGPASTGRATPPGERPPDRV